MSEERALNERVGVDIGALNVLLQRVFWGIHQADVIRIDIDATLEQLRARFPGFFVVPLIEAYVLRVRRQHDEADAALARARELVTPDHPLAYIMPTDEEWSFKPREQALEEVAPGAVWRLRSPCAPDLKPWIETYATVVRRDDGTVVVFNPGPMSPGAIAELRALGRVTHLVTPTKFHNQFIEEAARALPEAKNIGCPGHRENPPSRGIAFDALLSDEAPLFPDDFKQKAILGTELGEVVFCHRPSRTLIAHDLMLGNRRGAADVSFEARFFAFAFGLHDRVGFPCYHPLLWLNHGKMKASMREVLSWEFDRYALCHGGWDTIAEDARAELERSLQWYLNLGTFGALGLMGTFCWRQPSFLRDFLRYKIRESFRRSSPPALGAGQ